MLGTDKEPGIYVQTLNDLFRAIEETSDDMLYSVSMSYLEVRAFSNFFTQEHLSVYTFVRYQSKVWKSFAQQHLYNFLHCR